MTDDTAASDGRAASSDADTGGTDGDTDAPLASANGLRLRGDVTAVRRVSATEVPGDFPRETGAAESVALQLDLGQYGQSTTYLGVPDTDGDRLRRLLDVHGVDDPADLEGTSLLLDVRGGHALPVLPAYSGRGDGRAVYGIVAGVAPSVTIALFTFFGIDDLIFSPVYFGLYLLCTFLVLPVSIYLDALHLRGTTDWEGRPLLWAFLSVVPPLYIVVVFLYMLSRNNVRQLALDPASES